jgi:uncharacterized protein YggT (Ycf19 family)
MALDLSPLFAVLIIYMLRVFLSELGRTLFF